MRKILIIEDDQEISLMLSSFIRGHGYDTVPIYDGDEAARRMKTQDYDLILLDLMLPCKSGEELMRALREYSDVPVIVLSAKSMMETKLEVLRLGADDYIVKPFDLNEVLVRIEVVLRRSAPFEKTGGVLQCGGLRLHTEERRVVFQGREIALTAKEMRLLQLFLENPKKTFTKANLYETVWNDVYYYEDNTINVHISNLRSKLKKAAGEEFIDTVWGIGYRLREQ